MSSRKLKIAFLPLIFMALHSCILSAVDGCWQGGNGTGTSSCSMQIEPAQVKQQEKMDMVMRLSLKDRPKEENWTRSGIMRKILRPGADDINLHRIKKQLVQIEKRMGSRPPLCTNKCNACNPCEAVQMPAPLVLGRGKRKINPAFTANRRPFLNTEDSNYKPEGWKCKCGSLTYNP